jgi:hypothetical protein
LAEVLGDAALHAQSSAGLDLLTRRFLAEMPLLPSDLLTSGLQVESIGIDTPLERRAGTFCHVEETERDATLQFQGSAISGPRQLATSFRYVAGNAVLSGRSLPNDLDDAAKLMLVRRLVSEGLLRVVPSPSNGAGT